MVKDEDLCIHCGLCAERCPTAAWDMRKSELLQPYAGLVAGQEHARRSAQRGDHARA
jgi:ferredoxin